MLLRMFALAIRRIRKPNRRRRLAPGWAVLANVGPQPTGLGLAHTRSQYRHRSVVGVQLATIEDIAPQRLDQECEQVTRFAHPIGQGRAFQFDALPSVNLRLAVQREVVSVLRDENMRQQSWARQSALDGARWCRRLHNALAAGAAQLGTYLADHLELSRHILQHLGNIFPEQLQLATAIGTGTLDRFIPVRLLGQVGRQRTPRRFRPYKLLGANRRLSLSRSICLCPFRLEIFQPKFQLLDLPCDLLRAAAELHAPQLGQQQLEVLDLGFPRQQTLVNGHSLVMLGQEQLQQGFPVKPVQIRKCGGRPHGSLQPKTWGRASLTSQIPAIEASHFFRNACILT